MQFSTLKSFFYASIRKYNSIRFNYYSAFVNFTFFTLLFFFIFFFPINLFKESILSNINYKIQNIVIYPVDSVKLHGINLNIDSKKMSLYYLSGLKFKEFSISGYGAKEEQVKFEEVIVDVSLLSIFLGKFNLSFSFINKDEKLVFNFETSLLSLFSQKKYPRRIEVELVDFQLDQIADKFSKITKSVLLNREIRNPNFNLIIPFITSIKIGGKASGRITFEDDNLIKNNESLSGLLKFKKFFINIQDPALNIPQQNFSTAKLDLKIKDNILFIDKGTRFSSEDLQFSLDGKITHFFLPKKNYNLKLDLSLNGVLKDTFSFLIPSLLNCHGFSPD
ncbi:MAG: hypothetical protein K2X39_06820, partial [Silvanigrellaceae bacterium]|nr:hypothetical protein [Silvanigrellaceae bacterium]